MTTFGTPAVGAIVAGFSPKRVPGLRVWLDADLGVTIATGVSAWADQSGTGNNVSQAVPGSQPSLDSSWRNGHKAIIGETSKWLAGTYAATQNQPCSVYCVVEWPSTVAAQRAAYDGIGASNRNLLATDATASNPGTLAYAGVGLVTGSVVSGPLIARTFFNGASSTVRFEPHGAAAVTATGNPGTQTALGLTVGSNYLGGVAPFNGGGKIASILVYDGTLTAAQDTAIFSYLSGRYNVIHT